MMVASDPKNRSYNSSWNSKISSSTLPADAVNGGVRHYNRRHSSSLWGRSGGTPSSIVSTDSDIKFTRKFNHQYKNGCCVLATLLLTTLIGSILLYLGYRYIKLEPGGELQFRGMFSVTEGDYFQQDLSNITSEAFESHASQYITAIHNIMRDTRYRFSFLDAEILAFDGEDRGTLRVYFNLKFNPRWQNIKSEDITTILRRLSIANCTIDFGSIFVEESPALKNDTTTSQSTTSSAIQEINSHFIQHNKIQIRRCVPIQLSHCRGNVNYNYTSYPNLLGHKNLEDVKNDLITFRELIDSECSQRALEFVCHTLQPACSTGFNDKGSQVADTVPPCRKLCSEFWSGCGQRLSHKYKEILDCSNFPEESSFGTGCETKKELDCKASLIENDHQERICDGILDCADISDELDCDYCLESQLHCGSKQCIDPSSYCNGITNCLDGSDEDNCLLLVRNETTTPTLSSTHNSITPFEGYASIVQNGTFSKICATEKILQEDTLHSIGEYFCQKTHFQDVQNVKTILDDESNVTHYTQVDISVPPDISFVASTCPTKQVLYVTCLNAECGIQPTRRRRKGVEGLNKMGSLGDWPWHAALFKDGVHVCDGTIVAPSWIITTVSCFQGQGKAEWIARFGAVRLSSRSPWQQERHIIGMVKSPVEGSTLVLTKLNEPLEYSNFVRPVCLPSRSFSTSDVSYCNTLGWTNNRESIERTEVKETSMESCANISIMTVNSLCAKAVYDQNNCKEEELAGSPMLCFNEDQNRWILLGVSNWRIACSMIGTQRPRLYDKTTSNVKWIQNTITDV